MCVYARLFCFLIFVISPPADTHHTVRIIDTLSCLQPNNRTLRYMFFFSFLLALVIHLKKIFFPFCVVLYNTVCIVSYTYNTNEYDKCFNHVDFFLSSNFSRKRNFFLTSSVIHMKQSTTDITSLSICLQWRKIKLTDQCNIHACYSGEKRRVRNIFPYMRAVADDATSSQWMIITIIITNEMLSASICAMHTIWIFCVCAQLLIPFLECIHVVGFLIVCMHDERFIHSNMYFVSIYSSTLNSTCTVCNTQQYSAVRNQMRNHFGLQLLLQLKLQSQFAFTRCEMIIFHAWFFSTLFRLCETHFEWFIVKELSIFHQRVGKKSAKNEWKTSRLIHSKKHDTRYRKSKHIWLFAHSVEFSSQFSVWSEFEIRNQQCQIIEIECVR